MANYQEYAKKKNTKSRLARKQARRTVFLFNKTANRKLQSERRLRHQEQLESLPQES